MKGCSFRASPDPDKPIVSFAQSHQWLYAQSSGSTGFAKTIRRTPESWIASFEQDRQLFDLSSKDIIASLGNLSHSLSLYAAVAGCHLGADVALFGGLSPKQQAKSLIQLSVSVLYATPAQLRMLLKTRSDMGVPSLRLLFSSGGKLDPELRTALHGFFPRAEIREIFGAAETSYITLSDPKTPPASVGRAYPGVEIKISNQDAEGVGEIWVTSPFLFDGYEEGHYSGTEWDGTWLSIGEMGSIDASGNLFLKGRKYRMVTVADKNVFPEEIELIIAQHPSISQAAAISVPDPLRGNMIVVIIELRPDATVPSDIDKVIKNACRTRIGAHAVPRHIRRMDNLPMLAAGKPDLRRLANIWAGL